MPEFNTDTAKVAEEKIKYERPIIKQYEYEEKTEGFEGFGGDGAQGSTSVTLS